MSTAKERRREQANSNPESNPEARSENGVEKQATPPPAFTTTSQQHPAP
jgi:hypothetical protein